jgi:transcriptional regulator with XRE-family HTH domain
VVRTILPYRKVVGKPNIKEIPKHPETIVDHLVKVRLERGLSQNAVGRRLGLSKDCVSLWERCENTPKVSFYPRIIAFLGYYPFDHETGTIAGKLQQLINCNGWNHKQAANTLGIDAGTVKRILRGERTMTKKIVNVIALWLELPDYLKQQYRPE